ncbi:MAG: hypothetical protein EPO36_05835 [Chloroflexota bacterium]|nr:MAG: hypothetical protein EPO36_05835 [Chloroflexota bacterium]
MQRPRHRCARRRSRVADGTGRRSWRSACPGREVSAAARYAVVMPRDPNIPDAFDVYTLVLLRRPANAPEMPDDELDALQARHLAHRAELRRQGILVANGPFREQSDATMRGLSIFACGPDEAARFSDADPSVQAGRLAYDLMEWWVAAGTLAFPTAAGTIGDRRVMPDD